MVEIIILPDIDTASLQAIITIILSDIASGVSIIMNQVDYALATFL